MATDPRLRIVRPCPMDWDSLAGDNKVRFCPECGKNVHNVSAVTQRAAAGLIAADGTVPCLRGVAAPDGTLMSMGQLEAWNRRQFTQTVLAAVPFAGFAAGQTSGGVLKGVARDLAEAPIAGTSIVLSSARGQEFEAKSDSNGAFEIKGIPAGSWNFKAQATGFASFDQTGVVIREGAETQLSFRLTVGSVGGAASVAEVKMAKRKLPAKLILRK